MQSVELVMLETFDSSEESPHFAENLMVLSELMVKSLGQGFEGLSMAVLENLFSVVALVKYGFVRKAIAAAAEAVVAVEDDVLAPYNAEPIPSLRLVNCHHPFQQKPWVSYTAVYPQSVKYEAYPVRFYVALAAETLGVSFLPLASAYPPQPLHEANFSLILLHLAIAEEGQVTAPWVDSKGVGL
jgi:hypothetical protein